MTTFGNLSTGWISARGPVCVAKTSDALRELQADWHLGRKTYHAWLQGVMSTSRGAVNLAIDGKPSKTTFKSLGWRTWGVHEHASLVEFELLTGRTHQIRRHAAALGHPAVGDLVYGHLPTTGPWFAPTCATPMAPPAQQRALGGFIAPAKKMVRAMPENSSRKRLRLGWSVLYLVHGRDRVVPPHNLPCVPFAPSFVSSFSWLCVGNHCTHDARFCGVARRQASQQEVRHWTHKRFVRFVKRVQAVMGLHVTWEGQFLRPAVLGGQPPLLRGCGALSVGFPVVYVGRIESKSWPIIGWGATLGHHLGRSKSKDSRRATRAPCATACLKA